MNNITDDALKAPVTKTIFEQLPAADRDKLVCDAIASLLTAQPFERGRGVRSKLQQAFDEATYTTARAMVHEKMTNDAAFRARIDGVLTDACKKVFEDDRENTVNLIAGALRAAFEKINRY